MKNIKKIVAVLLSMTAIASTTAMAATEATYEDGTASLVLAENDITAAANDQLTVVIVPKDAESITSGNIYYINQGAFGEEFTNILAEMKVKDGFGTATDYEVRIGGVKENDEYAVAKFYFKVEEEEVIIYGDVTGDGDVKNNDLVFLKRHLANWAGYTASDINYAAADINDDGDVKNNDLVFLKRHLANWAGYGTLPYKN